MPWVRIVLVNYNSGPALSQTVDALTRQSFADFEAVIVDNASTDGWIERLDLPDSRFRILRSTTNRGFAAGSNWGVSGAACPWIALLNPDAQPEPDWLMELHRATLRYPGTALFGSTQVQTENPALLDGGGDHYSIYGLPWRGGSDRPSTCVTSDIAIFSPCAAAALYDRQAFQSVQGLAESFFCYLEDVDLGLRLRLQGHRAIQLAKAKVHHAGSASTGRHSDFTLFHSTRNGIHLQIRCLPVPLLLLSLPLYLMAQIWLMRRSGQSIARLRGLWAGLRALPQTLRQRRIIQKSRKLSVLQVARLLVWNPRHLSRRDIVPIKYDPPPAN